MWHDLRGALRYEPTTQLEIGLALLALCWGVRLALYPWWPGLSVTPALAPLLHLAPEWGWAGAFLGGGLGYGWGVARGAPGRRLLGLGLLILWGAVLTAICTAQPSAPGLVTYLPILAAHIFITVRLWAPGLSRWLLRRDP